ncbi:MAG: hypothetical protein ACREOZ_00255, partial [Gloeomargaritales cyanobacterium]
MSSSSSSSTSLENKNSSNAFSLRCRPSSSLAPSDVSNDKKKPYELQLLTIVKKSNLKPSIFDDVMKINKMNFENGYKFNGPTFETCLKRLEAQFGDKAGGPPLHDYMHVAGFPPVDIYRNDISKLAQVVFADPELMKDGLWCYDRNARAFSELNTGLWWKETEGRLAT